MALVWDSLSKCADVTLAEHDTPARVKVGGKDGKFVPNINASKWNDKAWLNINFPFTVTNQTPTMVDGVAKIVLGGWSHRYYVKANGNLEYEFTINKKPPRNTVTLDLAFPDGLEFWKQGSLEEDWAESHHGCDTFEQFTAASHKPDNVVGSYAVYWKERDNGFKTGKFCHIFRPLVTDADGKTVWADLSIDPVAKTLTITVPQAWLNAAAYPIVVDPELGYSTQGAATYGGGYILGGAYTTDGTGGNVTKFHVYCGAEHGGAVYKMAISATNGSNDPSGQDTLEWHEFSYVDDGLSTNDALGTTSLAASTQYWVGCVSPSGNSYYYDSGTARYCKYSGVVYADQFVDPMSTGFSSDTYKYSMWVDYGSSGSTTESLTGSITAVSSTTNDFLSRYRYQIAPAISGAATTPNTFLSRIRYQMMQAVAGAATTVANLEELAGSIIETMSVAVTAVASTVGMIFRYRFDSTNVSAAASTTGMIFRYRFPQVVVTAVATTWANLVELGAAAARHFRVYMRIGRGRF